MTKPRQVVPGTTYLVTHRCLDRQFLLAPSRTVNGVFLYLLAVAAERHEIRLHAFCVLSNHYHLVVTDPKAMLPLFHQYLDGLVARALNAVYGRRDYFWTSGSYNAVALVDEGAIVDKVAYTLANPVTARLVQAARQWHGLWSPPEWIEEGRRRVARPSVFFDPEGDLPESVDLEITAPSGFESAAAFRAQVEGALSEREERARQEGGGFLGLLKLRRQRPTDRPRKEEAPRTLRPRVAARSGWKRVEALAALKAFVSAHLEALTAWRAGQREVLFPVGTYMMRVLHCVECAGAG